MASEPPVLIGFISDQVPDNDHTCAEFLSKFGGRPVWIDGKAPQEYPFTCSLCDAELDFVCQIATPYCANKRCLYLFGCHKQPDCCKSPLGWKVVRAVVKPEVPDHTCGGRLAEKKSDCTQNQQRQTPVDPSDWLQAAFGSSTTSTSCRETSQNRQKPISRQPPATQSSTPSCTDSSSHESELMPPFVVHVEDEPPDNSCEDATGIRARELQLDYEQREKEGSGEDPEDIQSGSLEAEAYEEDPDKLFLKLQKRLLRSPTQVIRYSFGGKPLFISAFPEGEKGIVDSCPNCGSDRVFEMQLVPAAGDEIQKRRHSSREIPIEWGVVAVFTCKLGAQGNLTPGERSYRPSGTQD